MKLRQLALAATMAAAGLTSAVVTTAATAAEQFFPALVYRTGAYAPNGAPFANGYIDYLKLTNVRGGINGVKVSYEECETGYATDRGVECYERLKGKNGGATVFQPLSTGITFALTEKALRTRFRSSPQAMAAASLLTAASSSGTSHWWVPTGPPLTY